MRNWIARLAVPLAAAVLVMLPPAPVGAVAPQPAQPPQPAHVYQLVVKVTDASGCSIEALAAKYRISVDDQLLASRRIYRAHSTTGQYTASLAEVKKLTDKMSSDSCVGYAEPDALIALGDEQFHSWTPGSPASATADDWANQPVRALMELPLVQQYVTGQGVTVAVLDTGVDPSHPVLSGALLGGHDFVDDDDLPLDAPSGTDSDLDGVADSGVGHGTFVAGLVTMVAPGARILPLRVLDSDGNGSVFAVAEAVYDAVAAGAQVVNMSFGTASRAPSKVLDQAIENATKKGVAVVAAAGNGASTKPTYPASNSVVWAVAATNQAESALASYSNEGSAVDVATVGNDLVGPLPGGLFGEWAGTSLSSPLVAGQFALLRAVRPAQDPSEAAHDTSDAINHTCHKLKDAALRAGVVDLPGSLVWLAQH